MPKGWKRINVPEVICNVIDRLAEKQNRARWEIVASALASYVGLQKQLDRKLWYIFKFLNSYSYLKIALQLRSLKIVDATFVVNHLEKFKKTCWQIQERLRIKTEHLVSMIESDLERYKSNVPSRIFAKWNDEVKLILKNLLVMG